MWLIRFLIVLFLDLYCVSPTVSETIPVIFTPKAQNLLSTGTTIVGICCEDGIVLGTDTRSTAGPLVMDKSKRKMHNISVNIFCCGAGTAADCDQVIKKAAWKLALARLERQRCVDCRVDSMANAANIVFDELTTGVHERYPKASIIVGGVDDSGPALFQIESNHAPLRVSFAALGSGASDALAVLELARRRWTAPPPVVVTERSATTATMTNSNHSSSNTKCASSNHESLLCGATINKSDVLAQNEIYHREGSEKIGVSDAINVVRSAVTAGILNDLGSGSCIDFCVIHATEGTVKTWRENIDPTLMHSTTIHSSSRMDRVLFDTNTGTPHETSPDNASTDGNNHNGKVTAGFKLLNAGQLLYSAKRRNLLVFNGDGTNIEADSAKATTCMESMLGYGSAYDDLLFDIEII